MNYLMNEKESDSPTFPYQNVEFYILNGKQYLWKEEHQNFAEHNGNEMNPEEINSLYLSRGIIVSK